MARFTVPKEYEFRHKPLDRSEESIRLVRVLPQSTEQLLELEIMHAALPTKYIAVSYVWGPAAGQRAVLVNRLGSEVRYNLWHFLNTMRQHGHVDYFWIDALCIDQDSIEEKNHQVQRMGRIYSKAEKVFAWLGNFSISQRLHFHKFSQLETALWGSFASQGVKTREALEGELQKKNKRNVNQIHRWAEELCGNEYWTRLWIVQEVALAASVEVYWGCHSAESRLLIAFLDLALRAGEYLGDSAAASPVPRIILKASQLLNFSRVLMQVSAQNLQRLLWRFGNHKCSDVRDRVFGTLSLTRGLEKLEVDYSLPKEALFWRLMSINNVMIFPAFVEDLREALGLTYRQINSWFSSHDYSNRLAASPDWRQVHIDLTLNYIGCFRPLGPRKDLLIHPGGTSDLCLHPTQAYGSLLDERRDMDSHRRRPSHRVDRGNDKVREMDTVFEIGRSNLYLISRSANSTSVGDFFATLQLEDGGRSYHHCIQLLNAGARQVLNDAVKRSDQTPVAQEGKNVPHFTSSSKSTNANNFGVAAILDQVDLSDTRNFSTEDLEEPLASGQMWSLRATWSVLRCLVNACV